MPRPAPYNMALLSSFQSGKLRHQWGKVNLRYGQHFTYYALGCYVSAGLCHTTLVFRLSGGVLNSRTIIQDINRERNFPPNLCHYPISILPAKKNSIISRGYRKSSVNPRNDDPWKLTPLLRPISGNFAPPLWFQGLAVCY